MPATRAGAAAPPDDDTGFMVLECLRVLTGPDGPRRSSLLGHLRGEAERPSRRLFARELAALVRRGRAGWRRAALALAELGAEGPAAVGDALMGCRSAAAQARLLEALALTADRLPAAESVPLLMLTSGLWFAGRTPAVSEAARAAAQRLGAATACPGASRAQTPASRHGRGPSGLGKQAATEVEPGGHVRKAPSLPLEYRGRSDRRAQCQEANCPRGVGPKRARSTSGRAVPSHR